MSITAGVLSQVSVSSTTASLSATATTGGTAPYTYQWYRSTTSGFSPGGGNLISGATALTLTDSGLIPNTQYYYKVVATDAVPNTATYAQLAVATTAQVLSQNSFAQSPIAGQLDLRLDYNTVAGQIDVSQVSALYPGAPVKLVPGSAPNSAPKFIGISANTDEVYGYINFDMKTVQYTAGSLCEVSQAGNVIYLYATGAIQQGKQVTVDISTMGGVAQAVGSSTFNIVGWAYDGAASAGALIRVKLSCPSFVFA